MINLEKKAEEGIGSGNGQPGPGRARTGKGEHGHERARERKPLAVYSRPMEKERQWLVGTAGNRNTSVGGVHSERQKPGIRPGVHI